jgi:hypothetical protein
MKDYLVIYEQADGGGWGAHSPDVEGVLAPLVAGQGRFARTVDAPRTNRRVPSLGRFRGSAPSYAFAWTENAGQM